MSKKYIRYGVSDIVLESKAALPKYAEIKDINGNVVDSVEIYYLYDEDENGEEIMNE